MVQKMAISLCSENGWVMGGWFKKPLLNIRWPHIKMLSNVSFIISRFAKNDDTLGAIFILRKGVLRLF